jgi:collagenase-like PrtC family protease
LKGDSFDRDNVRCEFETLKKHGIFPALTFSNHLLSEEDVESCLKISKYISLMELAMDYVADVVVSSPVLERHIRIRFPDVSLTASVVKLSVESGVGNLSYYKKLEASYGRFVVHPDDNFNFSLLAALNKDKAEILLNERCMIDCTARKRHYDAVAGEQTGLVKNGVFNDSRFLDSCAYHPIGKQQALRERNAALTVSEFERLSSMGFRHFKLQGRTDDVRLLLFDLLNYAIEDRDVFTAVYPILFNAVKRA